MEHIRSTITGSITWRIPELCTTKVTHLCSGYIRVEFEDAYHIPQDIIKLCTNYCNTDGNILNELKDGAIKHLSSKIFHLDKIKFVMSFRTDTNIGYGDTPRNSAVMWKIHVPYLPKGINKIELDARMQIIGTGMENKQHFISPAAKSFDCSKSFFASKIKDLDDLQLQLKIFDMKQYDENNNIIAPSKPYEIMKNVTYATSGFVWRITDKLTIDKLHNASAGVNVTSPLFLSESFKWMVKISYYDMFDADLCIYLASLSPQIERLCIYYKICLEELDRFTDGTQVFGCAEHDRMSLWKIDFFKNSDIKNLQRLTIKVEISIVDIFYSDDYKHSDENIHKYHTSLNTINGKYEWKIDDKQVINKMKTADSGEDFMSAFFEINKFKWCLKAYPNGYSNDTISKMNTFLRLASLPPNIGLLCVHYEIQLMETHTYFAAIERFNSDSPSFGWTENLLLIDAIKECQTFTFKVKLRIIEIFDNNGNIITNKFIKYENEYKQIDSFGNMAICKYYRHTPYLYEWKISDINIVNEIKKGMNGKNFLSPIFTLFNLRWYLEFMPLPCDHDPEYDDKNIKNDYSILYFCAASVSPMVKVIRINYCLMLKETNTIYKNCTELDGCFSTGWSRSTLKRNQLNELNTFTFGVRINFIDIHNKLGNNITDEFVNCEMKTEEEKSLTDIELPMLLSDTHEWVIDNVDEMNKLKCAENAQFYMSDMFIMHGFKWKMKIYPNGTKPQRKGIFNWYFNLISVPPNISKVSLFYKIIEIESGAMDLDKTSMRCDCSQFGWGQNKLKLNDIMIFDKMCFVLELKIIDIFDKNGRKLNMKEYDKIIPLKLDENEWKLNEIKWEIMDGDMIENIKRAKVGMSFKSEYYEIDGFKWYLRLIPNGKSKQEKGETKLYICVESLPMNVDSMSFYFEIGILESNLLYSNYGHFRDGVLCKSWLTSQIKIAQFKHIHQLTLIAKIKIVDVYHKFQ